MGAYDSKRLRDTQLGRRLWLGASYFAEAGAREHEVGSGVVQLRMHCIGSACSQCDEAKIVLHSWSCDPGPEGEDTWLVAKISV